MARAVCRLRVAAFVIACVPLCCPGAGALGDEGLLSPRETGAVSWEAPSYDEAEWLRDRATAYTWGGRPDAYTHQDMALMLRHMGARVARVALPGYLKPGAKGYDPSCYSWVDRLKRPEHQAFLDRFDTLIFTVSDGGAAEPGVDSVRKRFGELAEYLLREYENIARTFVIAHWEGDHIYREPSMADDPERVQAIIDYFDARHQGLVDARQRVPGSKARVYDALEINRLDYEGEQFLINRVVPHTRCDLYSISAYTCQDEMLKGLGYMKSRCPDSPAFGDGNILVGEFGLTARNPWQARIAFIRDRLAEIRAMDAQYAVQWALVSTKWGIILPKHYGGLKRPLYYWYYAGLHLLDDRLVIDDFEADDLGLKAGETDGWGYSLNCLGGRRRAARDSSWYIEGSGSRGRALRLRLGRGSDWSETLPILDASRFAYLTFLLDGAEEAVERMSVELQDADGARSQLRLREIQRQQADGQDFALLGAELTRFRTQVDLTRICGLRFLSLERVNVELDEIALDTRPWGEIAGGFSAVSRPGPFRISHLPLTSGKQHLLNRPEQPTTIQLQASTRISDPLLTDGEAMLPLADSLPESSTLTLNSDGTGRLRSGGPLNWVLVQEPRECVPDRLPAFHLTAENMGWNPNPPTFRPQAAGERCCLQWHWRSPWAVTSFSILVGQTGSGDEVVQREYLCSADGLTWTPCPGAEGVLTQPEGFEPTRLLFFRFAVTIAELNADLQRKGGVGEMLVDLELDTAGADFPSLRGLRYRDANRGEGFRGLLNLNW